MESINSNNIWSRIKMGNVLQQVLLLLLFSFLNQTKSDDDPGLCRSSGLGSNFTKTQQMCMMPIRMDPIMVCMLLLKSCSLA
jgi:hypothetical protein